MAEPIKDGSGNAFLAKVNANQRLYTNAVTLTETEQAIKTGRAFNINTGVITLTDAVDTPVLYLKNNETEALHITAIAVGVGPSTGGDGEIPKITVIRNPTAGTIISSPTNADIISNRNFGSADTLTADVYKGATDDTMTDGDDHIIFFQTENGRLFGTVAEFIPKGSSIGVKFDPEAGNTSQDVYVALICHLEDPSE